MNPDLPNRSMSDAMVELIGFAFYDEVPGSLTVGTFSTPRTKEYAWHLIQNGWQTTPETSKTFLQRLPDTKRAVDLAWEQSMHFADWPARRATIQAQVRTLFPAVQRLEWERQDREDAARAAELRQAAGQQHHEAQVRSQMTSWVSPIQQSSQRYLDQQNAILRGTRSSGTVG
jgi:hypothetical protein